MESLGFPMKIVSSVRTVAEQQKLYAQGRTAPGPIVTNADGVMNKSKHQLGLAVDCAFIVNNVPSWDWRLPWIVYGTAAEALGLEWGGRWKKPVDSAHVELNEE